MARWRCPHCGAGETVPTLAEAGARLDGHDATSPACRARAEAETAAAVARGGSVRVVEPRLIAGAGDVPRIEPARLLGGSALTVVCEPGQLLNPHGGALTLPRVEHVGALVDVVTEAVGAIFVTPAAAAWLGLPEISTSSCDFVDKATAAGWQVDGSGWLLRVRRAAGGRPVSVVLLGWDRDGYALPWSKLAGAELVAALRAFRDAVGVCAGPSLGATAERVLLASHPREKGGVRLDPEPRLPAAVDELAEIGSTWRAPLVDAGGADPLAGLDLERFPRWVLWYDANANYLGAYQAAELGRGEAMQLDAAAARLELAGKYLPAGLWRADLPALEAGEIPAPWSTTAGWHTSPTIRRARELLGVDDVSARVTAAWCWPLKSRFCEPFGVVMRDARARLLEHPDVSAYAAAMRAVTGCYQRLHGRLGAGFRAGTASPLFRPDWMHTIRATARVNFDRRIRGLEVRPFAVDVDAAYFVADTADPEVWATRVGLPLGPRAKLGAFRPAGGVILTEPLRAALDGVHTAAATRELLRSAASGEPIGRLCSRGGAGPTVADLGLVATFAGELVDRAAAGDGDDVDELDELAAALAGGD